MMYYSKLAGQVMHKRCTFYTHEIRKVHLSNLEEKICTNDIIMKQIPFTSRQEKVISLKQN